MTVESEIDEALRWLREHPRMVAAFGDSALIGHRHMATVVRAALVAGPDDEAVRSAIAWHET